MVKLVGEVIEDPLLRNKFFCFKDRVDAGEKLASLLARENLQNTLILAIPNGGVPVACMVSLRFNLPIDLVTTRKVNFPDNTEAGFGAVTPDGNVVLNRHLLAYYPMPKRVVEECIRKAVEKLKLKEKKLRGERPYPPLRGKKVILIDDGLATGCSMFASISFVKRLGATEVIVAVPTGSIHAVNLVASRSNRVYCLNVREHGFFAVADAYENWYDVDDEEVLECLEMLKKRGLYPPL